MTIAEDRDWFGGSTAGAPEALRARSERFFESAMGSGLPDRLAAAGQAALVAAMDDGAARAAALDLLAADALITLALLHAAQSDPASLGGAAVALRRQATTPA
jgi:hypothetical protein